MNKIREINFERVKVVSLRVSGFKGLTIRDSLKATHLYSPVLYSFYSNMKLEVACSDFWVSFTFKSAAVLMVNKDVK